MTIPLIIDTDPGIDDAVMLSVAMNNKNFDIQLITTVFGNVSLPKTTINALKLIEFFDHREIPVAKGAEKPLIKPIENASNIHGESGMGDYPFVQPTTQILNASAVDAMAAVLDAANEPVTIVATGAYTNIANLITKYPNQLSKIKELAVMGGTLTMGNMTSAAEFNIFSDPDAADIVFNSGLPLTMIGLDVTMLALLTPQTQQEIPYLNKSGQMLANLINYYQDGNQAGKPMHDVVTLFYLLHPESFGFQNLWIDIVKDGPAIGETVADTRMAYHQDTNTKVALSINSEHFNSWIIQQISGMVAA